MEFPFGKIFRPLILSKIVTSFLDDVFMQSQSTHEMSNTLEKYHQTLLEENMKAAPDKSQFFFSHV